MRAMREEILALYTEVYAGQLADPFRTPERFWDRLDAYANRDGFAMVTGHADDDLVGFALGYTLPENSRWWTGLQGPHADDEEFTREDGNRTFAFNELMVHPSRRGHGFGHALHDALLRRRTEQRATLLVRPDNEPARSAYLRWGWRMIGTVKPFTDSPIFEVLVLPLR
ncbi:GNAT family N-acetyltransferase [Micromonospora sp. CPCC 205371]|nr:GNAT family N-acetyltransferase [Micromonospora sp. CPCC 205371]